MNLLSSLPVVRSATTRAVFLASTGICLGLLLWIEQLRTTGSPRGLAPIFFLLFAGFDYRAATWALLILLGAAIVRHRRSPFERALRWPGEHPVLLAVGSTIFMSLGALVIYRNHPLSMDEYVPVFQSQVFAGGRLSGQFPVPLLDWLVPRDFQTEFLNVSPVTGRVASAYWPSFALLLTPFTWLGIPWACNPLLSALTLIALHRLALHLFEDPVPAGLAVVLTAASPVFFANGISYYSMPAHLLANTVYALLLVRPTARRTLAAGVVGSVALTLHNPLPHLLFLGPWLLWIVVGRRRRLLMWILAGYLPLSLILGVGWVWFSSALMREGLPPHGGATMSSAIARAAHAWFTLPTSSILLARLIGLAKLWLWAVPGIILLAGVGAWRWRHDARCRTLLASGLATLAGYLFVGADQGHGWGFRYFHPAWLVLPLLAAAAAARVPAAPPRPPIDADPHLRTFVVACALLTLVAGVTLRGTQVSAFMAHHLRQLPQYTGAEPHVVMIDVEHSFYAQDLVQNDPFLRGARIRMISRGAAADAAVIRDHFPGYRRVYADAHGEVWSAASSPGRGR